MSSEFRPCFLIPCYNHHRELAHVLDTLAPYGHPVYIVNDGSQAGTTEVLRELAEQRPQQVRLLERLRNGGKGAATMDGLWHAYHDGYTHALQVDADGQHDLETIPAMLAAAAAHPHAMVLGSPRYGKDAPLGRLVGRQISRFWVWVETLSFAIEDPLIGFRVYPLAPCIPLIRAEVLGNRMDFDLQILVRLYWAGVQTVNIATRIIYPEEGVSHFRVVRDNIMISKAHAALFFGMLPRIPRLLFRKGRAA